MRYLIILGFLCICIQANSQDTILMKNGDTILSKILEITKDEIKYKRSDIQESPYYSIMKSDVRKIIFPDGKYEEFRSISIPQVTSTYTADSQIYYASLGKIDADENFNATGASTATFLSTIVGGALIGLIPAISCSSTPPRMDNLNFPNPKMTLNNDYVKGYREAAYKKKRKSVWSAFGIGTVINIVAFVVIASK